MDQESWLACALGPCPECGNSRFEVVCDGQLTNLLCRSCGTCWHAELESTHRIDPDGCPGCPSRAACEALRRSFAALEGECGRLRDLLEGQIFSIPDASVSPVVDWDGVTSEESAR